MKPRVHYSVHGKPACLHSRDYSLRALPPNTSTLADAVTCRTCLRLMRSAVAKLTPRKVKR